MLWRWIMGMVTRWVLAGGAATFRRFIRQPRLHPPVPEGPEWEGGKALEAVSRDGTKIRGWWQPGVGKAGVGTILFVHGITVHSFCYLETAAALSLQTGWEVAGVDLRFHGLSDDAPLTFGAAESWDVRAFLDALENAGAPRPYAVIGDSLGGLATQRAAVEDIRIDGAVLMQVPGWPQNAICKVGRWFAPLAGFLKTHFAAFERDIIKDGDPRNMTGVIHKPTVMYVMGEVDFYGWRGTQEIYDWWGTKNPGALNETPLSNPDRSRWMILIPGAEHDTGLPDSYNVWRWEGIWPNLIRFIEIVGERFREEVADGKTRDKQVHREIGSPLDDPPTSG